MGTNVDFFSRASSENQNDLSSHYGVFNYRPQRSWGKVIFSQASVILLTGRNASSRGCFLLGGCFLGGCFLGGVPPPRGELPPGGASSRRGGPGGDGYCCGRYASYWNAFLLNCLLTVIDRVRLNRNAKNQKNDNFTCFNMLMWLQVINKVKFTHQGEVHIKVKVKISTSLQILCSLTLGWFAFH